jgi:hypothetical protein
MPGLTPTSYLEMMEWLRDNMQSELERLNLPFVYLADSAGEPKRLHTADIQSCLCEFHKYTRLWTKESNKVRKFKPSTPSLSLDEFPVHIEPVSCEVESISDIMIGAFTPDVPSAAEHERLAGIAVPGSVHLQGVGGHLVGPGNAVGGQPLPDYAAQLAQAGLLGSFGPGILFDQSQPRLVLIDPLGQFGPDVPYALLITAIGKGSAGVAPVENLGALSPLPTNPDHPGTGEAEVQP